MDVPLYLRPRVEPPLASLLRAQTFLHSLVDALGSPLNVLIPEVVAENAARFRAVQRRHHLAGRVYYAHKANRSSSLVRRLAAEDVAAVGIDVASLEELRHALGCGFTGDRIMATGPKDAEFLWLAARVGATVNLDSPGELEQLAGLVRGHGLARVDVLVRLSGFESAAVQGGTGTRLLARRSRFGTPVREAEALLSALERHRDVVELTGVAYHLDTTGVEEKARALEQCVLFMDECRARGLAPRALDIGGGFGVGYLADAEEWERWTTALSEAVLGVRPPLTWRGHGYGLRNEGGTVRGNAALYPAHRPTAGPGYLDELLSMPAPVLGRPSATLLLEHLHDLYIEPGRSLVDQCGLSLARVLDVRPAGEEPDRYLVRLGMNAGDMSLEEHGVLMDPVLLPRGGPADGEEEPVGVFLAGNLCLEADLITRRLVHLPRLPRAGDLLAFTNTAGYAMDFHAHRAQRQPLARTVAVEPEGDSWRWCLDEDYWPLTSPGGTTA
ncbi:Y4yA family PLP-dependent enzyme [Streptomyces capillispiralis]|uniref:Diaminopimelate decarboxylase n=1 Tax=Streptomyces capillispiralis TaxID=68182 RepID=A0A561T999_9ACTN|nr:Y4yA family PLP-dependent enzyme [Streptomyces capillispiralis]TWF83685.1 diaminopimelate decarboxylase [Streptomyces capillispiralis]GHH91520.1 diaminopimelate decarboxylase [Streptomyces capillispiralis]